MSSHHLPRTVLLALAAAATPFAQGRWSPEFDRPGLVGGVYAFATYGGALYAGGDGLSGGSLVSGELARFDGVEWHAVPGAPTGALVGALTEYGGELVAAGDFLAAGSVAARSIARFDGTNWRPLGLGLEGEVFDLQVFQGELVACGRFTRAGGQPLVGIARWDGAQWRALGGSAFGPISSTVWTLTVGSDGRLYAGGDFDSIGGVAARGVAAWDGVTWARVGPASALIGSVHALAWHQGRLYAGGAIDFPQSTNENIVVYDGATWNSLGGVPDHSIASTVNALASFQGHLYIGGNFREVGGAPAVAVARYDGTVWERIGGVADSSPLHTSVLALEAVGASLLVGGEFELAGFELGPTSSVVSHSVAAYDGAAWAPVGLGQGFDAEVRAAVPWNGGIAAVGRFTQAGTVPGVHVAWFDGDRWRSIGNVNGNVNDCVEYQGDLVITGEFTAVDGQPMNAIARYDGATWSAIGAGAGGLSLAVYQGELFAGGLGGYRRWNGASWSATINPGFSFVRKMHVHTDGRLYLAGGSFQASPRIFSFDGTNLSPLGAGVNGTVEALCSYQGDLVVGGEFTMAGGGPANRLARWDGASWSAVPGVTGSLVRALTVFQGELVAGGDLVAFSGNPADWLARFDGAAWRPFGLGLNGTPFTFVADDAAGRLYVGGLFTQADWSGTFGQSTPSAYFARWEEGYSDDLGSAVCAPAVANATGLPGTLLASGSPFVGADEVTLAAAQLPTGALTLFLSARQAVTPTTPPGSVGRMCLGGGIGRYVRPGEVQVVGPNGAVTLRLDLAAIPTPVGPVAALAGDTWHHQCWYRDHVGGVATSNFTVARAITFR